MRFLLASIPLALALYVAFKVFGRPGREGSEDDRTLLLSCPNCGLYVKDTALRCPRCGRWLAWRLKAALSAFAGTLIAAFLLVLFFYLLGFALILSIYIAIGVGLAMLVGKLLRGGES